MSDEFGKPAASEGLSWETLNGALLLFEVTGQEQGVQTDFGPKDPIVVNVAVLDGPNKGAEYDGSFVFPKVLISQLKPNMGRKVLGRLGQGQAKKGQKPPWKLTAATAEDTEVGKRYLAYKASQGVATPAPGPKPEPQADDLPPF